MNLEQFWTENRPLISKLCWKYTGEAYPPERNAETGAIIDCNGDLLQECFLALAECAGDYEQEKGSFLPFALHRMEWHLLEYMRLDSAVVVPVWLCDLKRKVRRYEDTYFQNNGFYPADNDIITALEITQKQLDYVRSASLPITSLNAECGEDGDSELIDTLVSGSAAVDDTVTDAIREQELNSCIWDICRKSTTKREFEYLDLRYKQGESFADTADKMGVSSQRIDSLKGSAFRKLRQNTRLKELAGVNGADLPEKIYYSGGFQRFKNSRDTSHVEKLAIKNVSIERSRSRRKQENIEDIEAELLEFWG